jgi:nitrate reductase gamma subunit
MRNQFLFTVAPYVAALGFPAFCLLRYALWHRDGGTMAPELANPEPREQPARFAAIWRGALVAVLGGHLLGLQFPANVLMWNQRPLRLFVLEGSGIALGAVALAGLLGMLWLRLRTFDDRPERSPLDVIVWTLIAVQVASGVAIALLYRWASSWSVVTLTPYLVSLVRLKPAVNLIASLPFLVRLHVFCLFAIVFVAPFTSLARLVILPLHDAATWALTPVAGACGRVWSAIEVWARINVQSVFPWAEEDN